jgi:hypothetical protein
MVRDDLKHRRVVPARDVVHDVRARREHGVGHRRPERVDRDQHLRVVRSEALDERDDAIDLLVDAHGLARATLHSADVDDVGALVDQRGRMLERAVQRVGGTPVVERIGCAVDDAHDREAARELEAAARQVEYRR